MPKSRYSVSYVEGNLVCTVDGTYWAYYEMDGYNYSFLSDNMKFASRGRFQSMLSQVKTSDIHLLPLVTEVSIEETQEKGKAYIRGNLADEANRHIDSQTDALIHNAIRNTDRENQLIPRFFVGFKLSGSIALGDQSLSGMASQIGKVFGDFVRGVNMNLVDGYVRVGADELEKYFRAERVLESQLSSCIKVQRLTPDDLGYIIDHLSGLRGIPREEYRWHIDMQKYETETLLRQRDMLVPVSSLIAWKGRCLQIDHERGRSYVAYLTLEKVIGELSFPGCEVLYKQQEQYPYLVDVSIRAEVVPNRKAVSTLRDKKKALEDVREHAYDSGNTPTRSLDEAVALAEDFEHLLSETQEPMYRMSYLLRVSADDMEELERRCMEMVGFYEAEVGFKLKRMLGTMEDSHYEFFPGGKVCCPDVRQPVDGAFISSLGFGATNILGEPDGFWLGFNGHRHVYLWPPRPAQAVKGSDTNSLAVSITGATGYGKSMAVNLMLYNAVVYGARAVLIDPKNERGDWLKNLPELRHEYNVIKIENRSENRGLLDPYVIMEHDADAESLAENILTYLLDIGLKDGDTYPRLKKALEFVTARPRGDRGLLHVIDELRDQGTETSTALADHVEALSRTGCAQLLFSRGDVRNHIRLDKQLNILNVADLDLPERGVTDPDIKQQIGVALLIAIGTFMKGFIRSDEETYKMVLFEEAWAILGNARGAALADGLVRMGRAKNAGIYMITQNVGDIPDALKNSIGLRFAFNPGRADTGKEVQAILKYMGLDPEDRELQLRIQGMDKGECLHRDLYGNVGMMYVHWLFDELHDAFDTSTTRKSITESSGGEMIA